MPVHSPNFQTSFEKCDHHKRYREQSGLTFVEVPLPHLHRASVAVYFRVGSRFETADMNGISHFLEHMMFRGTQKRPTTYAVNHAVESLGAVLFAATSPTSTEFELTLPSESLKAGIQLLGEILTEPLFADMEIERKIIIEETLEDYDEAGRSIDWDYLSRSRLWPDHPLGRSVTGPPANIERFTPADIREHYERSYIAPNTVVCVSGAFDPLEIRPLLKSTFEKLPKIGAPTVSAPPILGRGPTIFHALKPGTQTQIRVAFHAPGEEDSDYIALSVLLGILDDGMSTLLHRRIFDERGLAYNVSAGLDGYSDAAALGIDAAVSHDNVAEVLNQVLLLAAELKNVPPDEGELTKAKRRAAWALEQLLDEPQAMNAWYGEQELFHAAPCLSVRAHDISKVTAEDVLRVAARVFRKENLHFTSVGTVSKKTARELEKRIAAFE